MPQRIDNVVKHSAVRLVLGWDTSGIVTCPESSPIYWAPLLDVGDLVMRCALRDIPAVLACTARRTPADAICAGEAYVDAQSFALTSSIKGPSAYMLDHAMLARAIIEYLGPAVQRVLTIWNPPEVLTFSEAEADMKTYAGGCRGPLYVLFELDHRPFGLHAPARYA